MPLVEEPGKSQYFVKLTKLDSKFPNFSSKFTSVINVGLTRHFVWHYFCRLSSTTINLHSTKYYTNVMKIKFSSLYLAFSLIIVASDELQYIEKPGKSRKSSADTRRRLLKHQLCQLSARGLRRCATAWHPRNQVSAFVLCKLSSTVGLFKKQVTPRSKMKYLEWTVDF